MCKIWGFYPACHDFFAKPPDYIYKNLNSGKNLKFLIPAHMQALNQPGGPVSICETPDKNARAFTKMSDNHDDEDLDQRHFIG